MKHEKIYTWMNNNTELHVLDLELCGSSWSRAVWEFPWDTDLHIMAVRTFYSQLYCYGIYMVTKRIWRIYSGFLFFSIVNPSLSHLSWLPAMLYINSSCYCRISPSSEDTGFQFTVRASNTQAHGLTQHTQTHNLNLLCYHFQSNSRTQLNYATPISLLGKIILITYNYSFTSSGISI